MTSGQARQRHAPAAGEAIQIPAEQLGFPATNLLTTAHRLQFPAAWAKLTR